MSNTNGNILPPVSINDVKTVLGENSNNLSTLCISQNINMWSKYKPVHFSSIAPLSEENWKNNSYGIKNIPYWNNFNNMVIWIVQRDNTFPPVNLNYNANMYFYEKPQGTSNSPYRLSDFSGYIHSAKMPVGKCTVSSIQEDANGDFQLFFEQPEYNTGIDPEDLIITNNSVYFKNLHLGIIFYKIITDPRSNMSTVVYYVQSSGCFLQNNQALYLNTASGTFTKNAQIYINDINKNLCSEGSQTWHLMPFGSSVVLSQLTYNYRNDNSEVFVPLLPAASDIIVSPYPFIQLHFVYARINGDYSVEYDFTITNNTDQTLTTSKFTIYIYDVYMVNQFSEDWQNITMTSNSVHEYSSEWDAKNMNNAGTIKLVVEVNGQEFNTQTDITRNY